MAAGAHEDSSDGWPREAEDELHPLLDGEGIEAHEDVGGDAAAVLGAAASVRAVHRERFELAHDEWAGMAACAERYDAAMPDGPAGVDREDVRRPAERVVDELVPHVLRRAVLRVDRSVQVDDPAHLLLGEGAAERADLDAHRSRSRNHASRSRTDANHAPRPMPWEIVASNKDK